MDFYEIVLDTVNYLRRKKSLSVQQTRVQTNADTSRYSRLLLFSILSTVLWHIPFYITCAMCISRR